MIVALADNMAIGRGGTLPWHLSEDLKFFKRTTMGCPVIMGRRTWESIGRPLPGRHNIVVSRGGIELPENVSLCGGIESALEAAAPAERCFILGGGRLYASCIGLANCLYVTHIHTVLEDADTFFPSIDPECWEAVERSELFTDEATGWTYEFVKYNRR